MRFVWSAADLARSPVAALAALFAVKYAVAKAQIIDAAAVIIATVTVRLDSLGLI